MRSDTWYFYDPANVCAIGPLRFGELLDEDEVVAEIRSWLGVVALPQGSTVQPE